MATARRSTRSMPRGPRTLGLAVLLALNAMAAQARPIIEVAVAANAIQPLREIALAFREASGFDLHLVSGATGRFHAQIRHGAPFAVLFSADQSTPAALERSGHAVAGTRYTYAIGGLALKSSDPARLPAGPDTLLGGGYNRLALANPRVAPYGRAAMEVLMHLDLVTATDGRRVQGENVAQVYQFVDSGNVDLGFVALSQLVRDGRLTTPAAWPVPGGWHQPIRQDAVLLRSAEHTPERRAVARALLAYVRGPEGRQILQRYGYRFDEGRVRP